MQHGVAAGWFARFTRHGLVLRRFVEGQGADFSGELVRSAGIDFDFSPGLGERVVKVGHRDRAPEGG